jgi:hypothetical protein
MEVVPFPTRDSARARRSPGAHDRPRPARPADPGRIPTAGTVTPARRQVGIIDRAMSQATRSRPGCGPPVRDPAGHPPASRACRLVVGAFSASASKDWSGIRGAGGLLLQPPRGPTVVLMAAPLKPRLCWLGPKERTCRPAAGSPDVLDWHERAIQAGQERPSRHHPAGPGGVRGRGIAGDRREGGSTRGASPPAWEVRPTSPSLRRPGGARGVSGRRGCASVGGSGCGSASRSPPPGGPPAGGRGPHRPDARGARPGPRLPELPVPGPSGAG